jgi:hypothetical protein
MKYALLSQAMEPQSEPRNIGSNSKVFLQVIVPNIAARESIKDMFL